MYYVFEPTKKKSLLAKREMNSLIIDNNLLKYTFIKQRNKNRDEMKIAAYSLKNPFSLVKTLVGVYLHLDHLSYASYNQTTNEIMLVGQFTVAYEDMDTGHERVVNYNDDSTCITFTYNFADIDVFLDLLKSKMKWNACVAPLNPISL